MTTDDAEFLPDPLEDSMAAEAHRLAAQWADVPTGVLRAALSAAKAERALRSDETRLRLQLHHEREMKRGEREAAAQVERLRHRRHVVNVSVGAVISITLLAAGVAVVDSAPWLSVILCGPSLLALAKVFVLHRSDPDDMKQVSRASNNATNAASQPQPQQPPPAP
ncbi:hypothetical protein [Streptomyces sp. NPDC059862]|uniref:hypothetical protein n=1 Tax=unclassified Streptomyces TaxID=2593676 RepID=UPI00363E7533